jgi:NADH dehydrogenase
MRIAITGGTGFVGGHLAATLANEGHDVVVLARGHDGRPFAAQVLGLEGVHAVTASISDRAALVEAFSGCDAVAHCAGINREIGAQTYEAIHVQGTANVVAAAHEARVTRLSFVSFLRARPGSTSAYHESKFAAEEIVRASALDWTVLKLGMMFGEGDHMLEHLSAALLTFPVFLGIGPGRVRPLAIGDGVRILRAALVDGELSRATVGVVGPTELRFDDAARIVAGVLGKRRLFLRVPLAFHYLLALVAERTMTVPLIARAQVVMLREEVVEALRAPDALPAHLAPSTPFDAASVRAQLPAPHAFGLDDLVWPRHRRPPSRADARKTP